MTTVTDRIQPAGPDISDAGLLERVREQDAGAHRTLFNRYYPRLFSFVQRRVTDGALAEELVADVFFEVWRNADRFRGESKVSTWLFGIAHFKTMAAMRQARRGIRGATRGADVEYLHRVPDRRDPTTALEARGDLRRLRRLMDGLPDNQREVVEMVFLEGMPYAEAAERLGVPEATIKTRISRARSRLRREMGGQLGRMAE
ncbi:MAG: RNA polymerase sigma factor [Myxococcota bacterium]